MSVVISFSVLGRVPSDAQSQHEGDAEKLISVFRNLDVDSMNYDMVRSIFDHELPGWKPIHGSCTMQRCRFEFAIENRLLAHQKLSQIVRLALRVNLEHDKIEYATLGYTIMKRLPRDSVAVDIQKLPRSVSVLPFEVIKTRGEGLNPPSAWIRMTSQVPEEQGHRATTLNLECLVRASNCSSVSDLSPTVWAMIQERSSH